MFRPALIFIVVSSGCWTFRPLDNATDASSAVPDSDARDVDADVADADSQDVRPRDMGPRDMDQRDTGPSLLTFAQIACPNPPVHVQLPVIDRPNGTSFTPSIAWTETGSSSPITAEVAWIDAGDAAHAAVSISMSGVMLAPARPFDGVPPAISARGVTLGPASDGGAYTWAVTSRPPCDLEFWWGGTNGQLERAITCEDPTIELFAMGVGGGRNPFTNGEELDRRVVWLSNEGLIVAAPGGFGVDQATHGVFSFAAADPPFTMSTRSELTFVSGSGAAVLAWNHNQTPRGTSSDPEDPPVITDIPSRDPGEIDVVSLSAHDYVVARVDRANIVIERYRGTARTATVERVGEWHRIDGLSNPHAVALATFRGGFALWYAESGLSPATGEPASWTVRPFTVRDNELTEHDCPLVYRHAAITYFDNKLIAVRNNLGLAAIGAVLFSTGITETINIEGPLWPGLLQ